MTPKGGTVTLDADEFLKLLDELEDLEERLRSLGSKGFNGSRKTPRPRPANKPKENDQPAMDIDLDISGIEWQTKDKEPAGPNTPWAWAFSTTQDGGVKRESMQLLQALEQYGSVRIGKYVYSLGGRNGNLLNRRVKK